MRTPQRSHHDVVVIGSRCAGAATAMLLARAGHDVAVVDRSRFPSDVLSTHGLVRGGVVQLNRWGLLEDVLATGAPAVREVTFRREDTQITRRIKERAGVDLLFAPRRHVLDALLVDGGTGSRRPGSDRRHGDRTAPGQRRPRRRPRCTRRRRPARRAHGAVRRRGRRPAVPDSRLGRCPGATRASPPTRPPSTCTSPTRPGRRTSSTSPRTRSPACFPPTTGRAACGCARPTRGLRLGARSRQRPRRCPRRSRSTPCRRPWPRGCAAVGSPQWSAVPRTCPTTFDSRSGRAGRWSATRATTATRSPGTASPTRSATPNCSRPPSTAACATRPPSTTRWPRYTDQRDAALRETFDLTKALASFPPPDRFVELQIQLSEALEREAEPPGVLSGSCRNGGRGRLTHPSLRKEPPCPSPRPPAPQRRRRRGAVRHPRRRPGPAGDRPLPVPLRPPLDQRHPQPGHHHTASTAPARSTCTRARRSHRRRPPGGARRRRQRARPRRSCSSTPWAPA